MCVCVCVCIRRAPRCTCIDLAICLLSNTSFVTGVASNDQIHLITVLITVNDHLSYICCPNKRYVKRVVIFMLYGPSQRDFILDLYAVVYNAQCSCPAENGDVHNSLTIAFTTIHFRKIGVTLIPTLWQT